MTTGVTFVSATGAQYDRPAPRIDIPTGYRSKVRVAGAAPEIYEFIRVRIPRQEGMLHALARTVSTREIYIMSSRQRTSMLQDARGPEIRCV